MESDLIPYTASHGLPARAVLVLAPHPDDEVFGCGGAIASHMRAGVPVDVVILTDGAGFGDVASRALESRAAAKVLGYGEPDFWGLPDRGVRYSEDLVQRLVERIAAAGVDLVYAPSPWEVHPDHRQTMMLAMEAVRRAGQPVRLAFYEVGAPLRPNLLLDITSLADTKEAAMRCFQSQLAQQDYLRHICALNQYRSYTLPREVLAAEAYWVLAANELNQLPPADLFTSVSPGLSAAAAAAPRAMPLVSILIRSMDRAYLAEALDSVALQTYPRIEVLVVAACVNHRPVPARCGPFALRLLQTDTPLPRSRAANQAMAQAHGDYFLFLDDDDWLMPGHIARLADVLAHQPHALAAYTGISLVDAKGRALGQAFDLPFDAIRQMAGNLAPIHAVLFSAKVLAQGCRFDEALERYEDWDFWLQLAKLAPMVHLPGVSGAYRIHESSGVHTDAGPAGAATALVYQKWAPDWTPEQISQIMQRVWTHPELEAHLTDTKHHLTDTKRQLEDTLAQQQQQTELMSRKIEEAARQLAQLEHNQKALLNSRSWRLTKPLRSLSGWLRKGRLLRSIRRLRAILASEGAAGIIYRLQQRWARLSYRTIDYSVWAREHDTPSEKELDRLRRTMGGWHQTPLISIVMPVYNPPLTLLKEAIESIQTQIYPYWELCIADDASPDAGVWQLLQSIADQDSRIKIVRLKVNGHISKASNSALEWAQGEFVALMDHDDLLPPDALYWVAEAVNRHPSAQVIYSDEDKLDARGQRFGAYFKPDWNYTLFLGHNLISHLGVYRTSLMREVGGFRPGLEGSQDYDLALRCIERVAPSDIVHIPRVLYHWRAIEGSTALATEAKPYALTSAQRALQEHRERIGRASEVEILPTWNYRCLRKNPGTIDLLSVVIVYPVGSLPCKTAPTWTAEPGFQVHEVLQCTADAGDINAAISRAQGTLVALMRVDLEPSGPQALLELVRHAMEDGTGIAGGTVRDASGQLVTGGLVLNLRTVASVLLQGLPHGHPGYMGRGLLAQELCAVSMDCVVSRKQVFEACGGLDTELGVSQIGAVAFCLRMREQNLRVVWLPEATWSETVIPVQTSPGTLLAQQRIFMARFGKKYANWLQHDPAYHPLLDATRADFSLRVPST